MTSRFVLLTGACVLASFVACDKKTPELEPTPAAQSAAVTPVSASAPSEVASTPAAPEGKKGNDPNDPSKRSFTLKEATADLKGSGAIVAKIDTGKGALQCKLFDDKAPITVANFIGLATGKRAWRDPNNGTWVNRPAYDGTVFHRIIKGFMIQGGDPKGNGSGEPGYVIPDEIWEGSKHDRAGLLCMANRGPNTNGAQFFITDAAAAHLDKNYTIFGECAPVEIVHEIASMPAEGDQAANPVKIKSVTISRDEKKK